MEESSAQQPSKLYYSIREVSEMIGVNASTLRYWEKEIPQLKPHVNASNQVRLYSQQDIELLRTLYSLVKVRGFKLAAARRMLTHNRYGADKSSEVLQTLISVRDQLKELKRHISGMV